MRKISLDVNTLKVESFATADTVGVEMRGTVRGHSSPDFTCVETCDYMCPSISGPANCDCAPSTVGHVNCP